MHAVMKPKIQVVSISWSSVRYTCLFSLVSDVYQLTTGNTIAYPLQGTIVIYQYAPGSPFEDRMNDYMTTGTAISPFAPLGKNMTGWRNGTVGANTPGKANVTKDRNLTGARNVSVLSLNLTQA